MIGLEWKVLVLLIMFVSNISSSILTVTRDNHTIPLGEESPHNPCWTASTSAKPNKPELMSHVSYYNNKDLLM